MLSLRMFVVILALLGVASALQIVVPRYRQHLAIRNLEKLGAKVQTRAAGSPMWTGARQAVFEVKCGGMDVSDNDLANLAQFAELETLILSATSVTDDGMEHLHELANLKQLYLDKTWISDVGLSRLKNLTSLEILDLSDSDISDDGLKHLAAMQNLYILRLRDTRVDGTGFVHLRNLPKLEVLNLLGTVLIEEAFEHIAELPHVGNLYIDKPDTEGMLKGIRELRLGRPDLWIDHSAPYCGCVPF